MTTDLRRHVREGKHLCVSVRLPSGTFARTFRGGTATTLRALIAAGDKGVTAAECLGWTYSLAAYVYRLRRAGLQITTTREAANSAWRARYRLLSSVCVILCDHRQR